MLMGVFQGVVLNIIEEGRSKSLLRRGIRRKCGLVERQGTPSSFCMQAQSTSREIAVVKDY